MKGKAVRLIFGAELPSEWRVEEGQENIIIASESLRENIEGRGGKFVSLEALVEPGSIYEATTLLEELPSLRISSGQSVSESFLYKGYPLWWIHYNPLFLYFCLPFTRYRRLLERLKDAKKVFVYKPPFRSLFRCFFAAHGVEMIELKQRRLSPSFLPFGVFLQIMLTILFLPFLFLLRRPILVFTGDKFEKGRDHDFRLRYIYEELRKRKLPFVEFIRGLEPWGRVLSHGWTRRRPVIYAEAVTFVSRLVSLLTGGRARTRRMFGKSAIPATATPEERFKILIATQYLLDIYTEVFAIRIQRGILRLSGVRAAYITAANERNFTTALACKLENIPTAGILHGFASRYYNAYDFMPGFEGEKRMGVDRYGVWSSWWRDYYLTYSKAYDKEDIVISGPMRPLAIASGEPQHRSGGPLRILFVAEQLAVPSEVMPYLEALLEEEDVRVHFKFRTYRDGFEDWLKTNRPDILARVPSGRVFRGTMQEAIEKCDVVVGSHSTAVLEALLQEKPCVLFYTKKWGDYFELESRNARFSILARTPEVFIDFVKESMSIPREELKTLQKDFFGDPTKNGSSWVVDQLASFLRKA